MFLERFHEAQASRSAGYDTALAEIRRGRKTSHWIWYIFPQLAGFGRSSTAQAYAIRDLAEACDYLRDPLLRARYEEITAAVSDQLARCWMRVTLSRAVPSSSVIFASMTI